jgi:hypothetical protein
LIVGIHQRVPQSALASPLGAVNSGRAGDRPAGWLPSTTTRNLQPLVSENLLPPTYDAAECRFFHAAADNNVGQL